MNINTLINIFPSILKLVRKSLNLLNGYYSGDEQDLTLLALGAEQ